METVNMINQVHFEGTIVWAETSTSNKSEVSTAKYLLKNRIEQTSINGKTFTQESAVLVLLFSKEVLTPFKNGEILEVKGVLKVDEYQGKKSVSIIASELTHKGTDAYYHWEKEQREKDKEAADLDILKKVKQGKYKVADDVDLPF